MASKVKEIGDAIVAYINDAAQQATYNSPFVAERVTLPIKRLEDMGTALTVVVFPVARVIQQATMRQVAKLQSFVIAVGVRVPKENLLTEDSHIELVEQIENSLLKQSAHQMGPGIRFEEADLTSPPFDPTELEVNHILVAYLPLTYRYQEAQV